jgi:hypothetical protein
MDMDIQSLSMDVAQSNISDQVSVSMLSKSIKGMKEQGAELVQLMGSAAPLPEGSGQNVDLFA